MPRRTTLTQQTQIGVEATPGTAVAANRRLRSMGIELGPAGNIRTFRPAGNKFPSITALGKEWSEGGLEGAATYTELIYAFSGILGAPTTTQPDAVASPTVYDHVWTIAPSAVQDPKTYTVEKGSSVRAHSAAHVYINELGLEFNREEINVNGAVVGRAISDGITLTASPTTVGLIPILPSHVSIYLDSTFAALGTTKLLDVMGAGFNLGSRFNTFWPIDAAVSSFKDAYEVEPTHSVTLTMEANATGTGLLAPMRAGDTRYLRIEAVGGTVEDAFTYRLRLDLPVKVTEIPGFEDSDGIYGLTWTFGLMDDTDAADAGEISLRNNIAAL